jgi:large subunit ribosomal protein L10
MVALNKQQILKDVESLYKHSEYVFVVNVKGLESNKNNDIRKKFFETNAKAVVIKNTINKIASKSSNHSEIANALTEQNMSVFTSDPVSVAKILSDASKGEKSGVKIVGVSDGKAFYGADYVKMLSSMPSMDVIRGSLLSVIKSVHTKIAYSLSYHQSALVRVISNNSENNNK